MRAVAAAGGVAQTTERVSKGLPTSRFWALTVAASRMTVTDKVGRGMTRFVLDRIGAGRAS